MGTATTSCHGPIPIGHISEALPDGEFCWTYLALLAIVFISIPTVARTSCRCIRISISASIAANRAFAFNDPLPKSTF
jgi:hypothetical protein